MNTTARDDDHIDSTTRDQRLNLSPNIHDSDGFYDELLAAHEGMDETASHAYNARLVLVLCNHIGDRRILRDALIAAASTGSAKS